MRNLTKSHEISQSQQTVVTVAKLVACSWPNSSFPVRPCTGTAVNATLLHGSHGARQTFSLGQTCGPGELKRRPRYPFNSAGWRREPYAGGPFYCSTADGGTATKSLSVILAVWHCSTQKSHPEHWHSSVDMPLCSSLPEPDERLKRVTKTMLCMSVCACELCCVCTSDANSCFWLRRSLQFQLEHFLEALLEV